MKKQTSLSIDIDLIEWVDKLVLKRAEYRSRSHIFELALVRFKETVSLESAS